MRKQDKEKDIAPTPEMLAMISEVRYAQRLTRAMTAPYLREDEAAFYCCLSQKQFVKFRREMGLKPVVRGGADAYRRSDLDDAMERLPYAKK